MRVNANWMQKWAVFYFFAGVFGLGAGNWHQQIASSSFRFPSGSTVRKIVPEVSYDKMPCPSDSDYRRLAARLKLEVPASLKVCDDKYHGPVARLLQFASELKFQLPPDFAPLLHDDLVDPIRYIANHSKLMKFDFSQTESVAYNRSGEINLGGIFFTEYPLEALSTLVHEARHSSPKDQGHTICRRSDIPKTPGGCDYELSIDPEKAGAYSYGAAFYAALGLYAEGLPMPDRQFLMSKALNTVSTRFNIMPDSLARAYDIVALLDGAGNVYTLHPFYKKPVPISLGFALRHGERVERIEFNVKNNGLLLFTSERRLFTRSAEGGIERLYADDIPGSIPLFDAARIRVPFFDYAYFTFLTGDRELRYYRFAADKGAYELTPYPLYGGNASSVPELSRIFMGLGARSLFQGKDGTLFVGQRYGNEIPFAAREDLQVPGLPWKHATGGVVFESLYGVTADGKTRYTQVDLEPTNEDSGYFEEKYAVRKSSFQAAEGQGKKILEGLTFRALLDSSNGLSFETYDGKVRSRWKGEETFTLADFAITRRHRPLTFRLPAQEELHQQWVHACRVTQSIPDPWFGLGMGLDQDGHLVIGGSYDQPCLRVSDVRYRDLKVEEASPFRSNSRDQERTTPFGDADSFAKFQLRLTTLDGKTETLRPYDYR